MLLPEPVQTRRQQGGFRHAAEPDPKLAHALPLPAQQRRHADAGPVVGRQRTEARVGGPGGRRQARRPHLQEDLAGLQHGLVHAAVEVREGHHTGPPGPGQDHLGAEGEQHRRGVEPAVRVGQVAAHGRGLADAHVAHATESPGQGRSAPEHRGRPFHRPVGGQRSDAQAAVGLDDPVQAGDRPEVHQTGEAQRPLLHEDDQGRPPGDGPRLLAVVQQHAAGFGHGLGSQEIESRNGHERRNPRRTVRQRPPGL